MKEALYARIEAFLNEFGFLRRYVTKERLEERPIVKRVDLDLLDRIGYVNCCYRRGTVRFVLIDKNGTELSEAMPSNILKPKYSFWHVSTWSNWGDITVTGKTIYQTIQKLNDPDQVKYILEIKDHFGGCRKENFDPDYGVTIILYKVPANILFSDWCERIKENAQNEIRQELTQIDQV